MDFFVWETHKQRIVVIQPAHDKCIHEFPPEWDLWVYWRNTCNYQKLSSFPRLLVYLPSLWHQFNLSWFGNPKSITLVLCFSFHTSSVFYLEPVRRAPVTTISGIRAKFKWNKWQEFRLMHRWDKQLLNAWGLYLLLLLPYSNSFPKKKVMTF